MLVLLTVFFIGATFVQAWQMQGRIEKAAEEVDLAVANTLRKDAPLTAEQQLEFARWQTIARLEGHAIYRRYHQASLVLMSRVWIIYLGFVTGMILALVGAAFILGKIREPTSALGADSAVWKFSITSASPGLILAVLGTVLMVTTMAIRAEVDVTDAPLYVGPEVQVAYPGTPSVSGPPRALPQVNAAVEEMVEETDAAEDEELRQRAIDRLDGDGN
jgi:hypothetical protein